MNTHKRRTKLMKDFNAISRKIDALGSVSASREADSIFRAVFRGSKKFGDKAFYKLTVKRFLSPYAAYTELGITRKTYYSWVENGGVPDSACLRIEAAGFAPKSLKRI